MLLDAETLQPAPRAARAARRAGRRPALQARAARRAGRAADARRGVGAGVARASARRAPRSAAAAGELGLRLMGAGAHPFCAPTGSSTRARATTRCGAATERSSTRSRSAGCTSTSPSAAPTRRSPSTTCCARTARARCARGRGRPFYARRRQRAGVGASEDRRAAPAPGGAAGARRHGRLRARAAMAASGGAPRRRAGGGGSCDRTRRSARSRSASATRRHAARTRALAGRRPRARRRAARALSRGRACRARADVAIDGEPLVGVPPRRRRDDGRPADRRAAADARAPRTAARQGAARGQRLGCASQLHDGAAPARARRDAARTRALVAERGVCRARRGALRAASCDPPGMTRSAAGTGAPVSMPRRPRPRRGAPRRRVRATLASLPIPGVFAAALGHLDADRRHAPPGAAPGARVLDLCTGSGAVAVAAALCGASVTAVDVSRRALAVGPPQRAAQRRARTRAAQRPVRARTRRTIRPHRRQPALPAGENDTPPARTAAHGTPAATAAPCSTRCVPSRRHLRPGGTILIVHSSVSDLATTIRALRATGLAVDIRSSTRRVRSALRARAERLIAPGLLEPGRQTERVAIVRGAASTATNAGA